MTISIESFDLDNGKTRRVATDTEAPDNTASAANDLFMPYGPKAVALWDIRDDEDGVRRGTFLMVRRDLQGQGYLRRLAPLMADLLEDKPLEFVNVVDDKVDVLAEAMTDEGSDVTSKHMPKDRA